MNIKKIYVLLAILGICILSTGCKEDSEEDLKETSREVFAMDTYMTLKAYDADGEEALDEAIEEIQRLDALWSVENTESEIAKLNQKKTEKVSKETIQLIQCAKKVSKETKGAFDITIYPLMELWGFPSQNYQVPSEAEIKEILDSNIGMDKVMVDEKNQEITLKDEAQIDLGGIAKGYTSEQVARILKQHDIEHGVISLGGNVQAIGKKIDGSRWKVGIQPPKDDMEMIGTYEACNEAVITSGGYERYFEEDGKTYHHILDPDTGKPSDQDLISVTVISEDGMLADCLSTTLFVMGKEKAEEYWKSNREKFQMILIDEDEKIYITEGMRDYFSSDYEYSIIE